MLSCAELARCAAASPDSRWRRRSAKAAVFFARGDRPVTRDQIYGFIATERTTSPVRLLCRVLQVSASAFYDWLRRGGPALSPGRAS